ncbi:MAG: hypothetical protein LBS32_08760 [Clostridiales Family XIII bacterium]|jgi:uncharacterized membrane protein YkvI|nr:hypothetical protein [Clostridiales Family XIII bacterium]
MENKQKASTFRAFFVVGGAYASYTIGAGFASGNEVIQFAGSFGIPGAFIAVLCAVIMNAYFCASAYKVGQSQSFARNRDVYEFFTGSKIVAWIFDVFVILFVLGIFATMFSGAGSMINQFLGLPQFAGSIILGIIAAVVVFGGFKRVENVLGYAGIIIIAFIVIVGIISLFHPNSSFDQSAPVVQMVQEGAIWQANMFGLLGLDWPTNPVINGFIYSGVCLIVCIPFIVALGRSSTNDTKQAIGSGIFSGIFFGVGFLLCLIILLANFNYVVDPASGSMFPIPALAAIQGLFGGGVGGAYMVILIIGIFTTVTGYLWLLTERVFGETKNYKSNIFTAVLMVFGVVLGSVLPFSAMVNFLWPISGFVGVIFVIFMIVRDIRGMGKKDSDSKAA